MPRPVSSVSHFLSAACLAALTIALACELEPAARAQAASDRNASMLDDAVDANIKPGDDFFAYANGGWLKSIAIPAGKGRWSAGSEIAETTRQQVDMLLDDANAAPEGSDAHKVADFRAAYLNEVAIEARGIAPLVPMLASIDRIRDKAGLTRFLGGELRADVDPMNFGVYDSSHILGLAVQAGNHGEKDYVAYLLQGGLGLPDRESYLNADPLMQVRRVEYQGAVERMLARLGGGDAAPGSKSGRLHASVAAPASKSGRVDASVAGPASNTALRAAAVMALETAIARSHATPEASANEHNTDTLWTRADFAREAPGMDWRAFFAAAGLAKQATFVAWQPAALKGVAQLVASQPLSAWKDYLRIREIARYAEVLPRAFYADAMILHGVASNAEQSGARAHRALDATQSAMTDAVGKMYVDRYFPPEHKARVQLIAANVLAAFTRQVEVAPWLSPGTRAIALAKLQNVYFGVGYPEHWQDYSRLMVDRADAVGNLRRIAQRDYRLAVARLGRPVDQTAWCIAPQWPGAVLTFHQNAYNFAAALLQAPKFDPSASDAANYGAIGAIIGHELSHFVDTLGAQYEPDGRLHRWWTDDDMTRYQAATEPLVRQFAAYRPFADVAVDGKLALTENVADLGGLVAAFDAYRRTLRGKNDDRESVRQQDRQFFIGFARSWRAKYRDDALRAQAAGDHAPENYRVSTVRNMDAWYDAFDVKPGERLYLEPAERVQVWQQVRPIEALVYAMRPAADSRMKTVE